MLKKLISGPVRLINAPFRAAENMAGAESEEDRILSRPLEELAKESDRALGGEDEGNA